MKALGQANSEYPQRQPVPVELVQWDSPFPEYLPPEWTHPSVLANDRELATGDKWADPPDVARVELEQRITFAGSGEAKPLRLFDARGKPLNPVGRTGLSGRGLLGKWGANQAADPIVTRMNQAGRLQVAVTRRRDTNQAALPGGMVANDGETCSAVVKRKFEEHASGIADPVKQAKFRSQVERLFETGKQVYRG